MYPCRILHRHVSSQSSRREPGRPSRLGATRSWKRTQCGFCCRYCPTWEWRFKQNILYMYIYIYIYICMYSCLRIYIHVYKLVHFSEAINQQSPWNTAAFADLKTKRCENSCCPAAEVPQRLPSVSYSDLTEIMGIVFMKGLLTLFNHEKPLRAYEQIIWEGHLWGLAGWIPHDKHSIFLPVVVYIIYLYI